MNDRELKELYLSKEVDNSIKLIYKGLAELETISFTNTFYHAAILLISSGFERLLKCLLCLRVIGEFGEVKGKAYDVREEGHDLKKLLVKLTAIIEPIECSPENTTITKELDFLKNDELLRGLLELLTDFSKSGRYYTLDKIQNTKSKYPNPNVVWLWIETYLIAKNERLMDLCREEKREELYSCVNTKLKIAVEKFARAIAVIHAFGVACGDFGPLGREISPLLNRFLFQRDYDLGKTEYRKLN